MMREEFAPYRVSSTGVVTRAVVEPSRDIEGLSPIGDASRRGRMCGAGGTPSKDDEPFRAQVAGVEGLFESLLDTSFKGNR